MGWEAPVPVFAWTVTADDRHGMNLTVHDFWATDPDTAAAMLAFLGRHNTRAELIEFRRGALPPLPTLLHNLHRHRAQAQSWHPWMLRILDIPAAISARGWPADIDAALPIGIENATGDSIDRYLLQIAGGKAELPPRPPAAM
ncbi:hypothetical protein [Actinacidiphila sp. bgisy160]|uniref:hypothetical protein n=1 Tax=Actinacidiphila sp. bgisy160 TaxID=3413796 RepID=UPI003D73B64E